MLDMRSGSPCFEPQWRYCVLLFSKSGSKKFCQRGSNFDNVFFCLMRVGRIQMPLLAGHQRHTSETPFKWRFAGRPMIWYSTAVRPE